jgi:exodeoxyribonuclease VII large subunit
VAFQEETYSVRELCDDIRDFLREAFSSVWVAGEVNRLRRHQRGHLYFELIEKGDEDEIVGKVEAVAWRGDFQKIKKSLADTGQELAEGQQIRCRGSVDFYAPFGRLQFVVREVDPVFTLGLLAKRRQETLKALEAAGLLTRNREQPLPELPLRLALITSEGSAAYHDFLSTLKESGFGFQVFFIHASVQGREAEKEVASALATLGGLEVDGAVLIRGGGSRADLAVFDSRRIAEAVARAPVPVLTGLGHEIDESISDLVAHTALKTPTKVAEFLVERLRQAELRLVEVRQALRREALEPLRLGREAVGRAERGLALARYRLAEAATRVAHAARMLGTAIDRRLREATGRLDEIRERLLVIGPIRVEQQARAPERLVGQIVAGSRGMLRELTARLQGWEMMCRQLAPEKTLQRGFSITRDSRGKLVLNPRDVESGDLIKTELARGKLKSRVEEG